MRALLILLVLLAACGRPLSPNERDFSATVLGNGLDPAPVRIVRGNLVENVIRSRPPRPRETCRERILPPERGPLVQTRTSAFVLYETIFYARDVWRPDFMSTYPNGMDLDRAMTLAHELTHVWQWQNRKLTGYNPFRAAAEHGPGDDPYLFGLDGARDFLAYPFEQQASLVEEYVCCRTLDPNGGRTDRLRRLLGPYFPQLAVRPRVPAKSVRLPSDQADLAGICA